MVGLGIYESSAYTSAYSDYFKYKVDILHLTGSDLELLYEYQLGFVSFKSRLGQNIHSIVINANRIVRELAWWDISTIQDALIGLLKPICSLRNLKTLYVIPIEEIRYNKNKSLGLL